MFETSQPTSSKANPFGGIETEICRFEFRWTPNAEIFTAALPVSFSSTLTVFSDLSSLGFSYDRNGPDKAGNKK